MTAAESNAPARDTGLPPGVRVGPLGRRLLAYVVDSVVPAAAALVVGLTRNGPVAPLTLVLAVVVLAWAVLCWRQLAVRAATPGMRLLGLQLVGFFDGRPVGWGRVLLRWFVWTVLAVTGIGLLLLIVSVLVSPRHQGWHDRAASAVVIVERPLAPPRPTARPAAASAPSAPRPDGVPAAVERAQVVPPVTASVAGDPALGPELAPLAAEPAGRGPTDAEAETEADGAHGAPGGGGHRTILDGWVAELDDGRRIGVDGLVLVGRNPQPGEGEDDAQLVKLADESRTVSKTHLALGVDDAGLFVVDRGSTNGSTITPPGQPPQTARPFHAVSVGEGSVVSIGDHWLRIRRQG